MTCCATISSGLAMMWRAVKSAERKWKMPNSTAYLALLAWPVIAFLLFKYLPRSRALIWTVVGAYLLLPPLPATFDFPLMPPLSKETLPNLVVFLIFFFVLKDRGSILPKNKLAVFLIFLFVLTSMVTVLTNREPIVFVTSYLPGLKIMDAIALPINQAILLLGFLMARSMLASEEAQRDILVALFIGGLLYSLPMLIEIRLSPQLNLWIYGFTQHLFEQSIRAGGYRPLVFLYHGIWAAFFMMTSVVAAFALWRCQDMKFSKRYLISAVYLVVILILCKTMGALLFAMVLVPLVVFASTKSQLRIATILAGLALAYPVLKGADLVPTNVMLDAASKVSGERAHSLKFRFDNEDALRIRAAEKPLFGWGSWGRNQLHNPIDGTITSISDGRWIITLGVYGWVGFIAEFGLLGLPMLLLWRETRHLRSKEISPYLGPVALILAINLIDLIPNATLTTITWLMSGALLGYAELLAKRREKKSLGFSEKSQPRTII